MATGHPEVWQQRKKLHECPRVPEETLMSDIMNKDLSLSDSEESDATCYMQREESVSTVPIRANNKRKESERVLETLLETPRFNKKVPKRIAGDNSPTCRRREGKKREKSTGHPTAVSGMMEKRAGGKKTGQGINDFPQIIQNDDNRPLERSLSDTLLRGGQGSTETASSVQRQLFSNGENATDLKPFNPERRRYLSRNQLGAVFVCVEGCSYTVTNGICTISEDNVGNSWKNNLRKDLENLGTENNLFLVGSDSRKAWKDMKAQFPSSVRDIYLDDTYAGKCTYCEKSECHRWKVMVAGLQAMVKFKTNFIEH